MNTTMEWNKVESLNDLTFGRAVVQAEDPVLVFFCAYGCPVDRYPFSQAEEIATSRVEELREYQVNLGENPFLADYFGLGGDPALILFHEGRVIGRWEDVQTTE